MNEIMKKVYLIPELSIVKVELKQMIAASGSLPIDPESAEEAASEGEDAIVLSRHSNRLWDEEEDY